MHYEEGTGSYQNDFLELILDTQYRYDFPYRVDKEKYNTIMEKYHEATRFKDADVVTFRCDYNNDDDDNIDHRAFFVWPENSPEGSRDFYDCIQFGYGLGLELDDYEPFVRDILDCIVCVDTDHAKDLKDKLRGQMAVLKDNIEVIDGLLWERYK